MSIELGKFNQLEVVKEVDFGVYLDGHILTYLL
jgi:predicted RNA-binding protein (virulence factor B family)